VIEEFLARIPEFELDRSRKATWAPGQVAGMGSVPIVFEPEEPLHDEPSTEVFMPGWSTRRPTGADFHNSQALACPWADRPSATTRQTVLRKHLK